jgi:signal transduction histidine kinase
MPPTRLRRTVGVMTPAGALANLRDWFTRDNLVRNRPIVEAIVAGLWFTVALFPAATGGGVLGIVGHMLLSFTLVLYRAQPLLGLTVGAVGTLSVLGSGFFGAGGLVFVFLPLLAVFFGVAAYGEPVTRWLGLVGTPIAALAISVTVFANVQQFIGIVIFWFVLVVLVLAWVAGMLVYVNRGRRAAQTGEIRATVQLGAVKQEVSLEQERNRVARDVHDIVAHSLAVVIAQADGARYGAKNVPAPVVEALENIATTARGALTDVRVLLGELRHNQEAGPQPGMNDLDALVRGFRDSGLEVEWHSYGKAVELTDAPALAVYRIVQEGLTNALRHGDRGQPVELVFDWGTTSLAVIVTNGIPPGTTLPANPAGHGIPGMRERATLAGGELEASDGTNGRFRVRATIPFQPSSAVAASPVTA